MKKAILLVAMSTMLMVGCQTKTGSGALGGAAVGAAAGGIIGGGEGALIGGAIGAVGGGLIGAALDEQDRKIMDQRSPRTVERMDRGEPLTISDVIKLSQGGVSDDTVIRYIRESRTTYHLSQAQIDRLRRNGVSQRVINYMIDTGY